MTTHILENVKVPEYKPSDSMHVQLAAHSRDAHEATATGDEERVKEIEEKVDQLAAELWGLTPQELSDIKRSLEELS